MSARTDERKPNEIRPTYLKLGVVTGSDGSSLYQKRNTKVISSVMIQKETEDAPFVFEVNVKCSTFVMPDDELVKRKQDEIKDTVYHTFVNRIDKSLYQSTTIKLNVFILEEDGGSTEAVITSASLALFDAGIVKDNIIVASGVVKCHGIDRPIVDPTAEEEEKKDGGVFIACDPSNNSITQVFMTGILDPEDISKCLATAVDSCWALNEEVKKIVESKMN